MNSKSLPADNAKALPNSTARNCAQNATTNVADQSWPGNAPTPEYCHITPKGFARNATLLAIIKVKRKE